MNALIRRPFARVEVGDRGLELAVLGAAENRLVSDHRTDDGSLRLPRTMTLVTATV